MKNKFIKYISVLSIASLLAVGCDNTDDNTGDSSLLTVNPPAVTINYTHGSVTNLVETDATYPFTISIAQPVDYDVVVKVTVVGGTATQGEDFDVPNELSIPAGSTSASGEIEIFADEIVEDTETFTLSIGGVTVNGNSNPVQVTFNIANLTTGDLAIALDWEASGTVTDNAGNEISPYALADLRLLLTDVPYTTIIDAADGGSAELFTLTSDLPNGEYYIVADFYSAMDIPSDLDLTVTFSQVGINEGESYTFAAALNTAISCGAIHFKLAKVIKTGGNYEIIPVGEPSEITAAPFVGTATVVVDDWADYAVGASIPIEAGSNPYEFYIRSTNNPYISNPDTSYMIVTIDPLTGNATVTSNEDFEYGCSEGDVTGSGTVNACAGTIDLVLSFGLGNCGVYANQEFSLQL